VKEQEEASMATTAVTALHRGFALVPWQVMTQFGGAQTIQSVLDAIVLDASRAYLRHLALPHAVRTWSSYRACLEASLRRIHYPGLAGAVSLATGNHSDGSARVHALHQAKDNSVIVIGEVGSIEKSRIEVKHFGPVERMMAWPTVSSLPNPDVRRMLLHDQQMGYHTLCAVGAQIQHGEFIHARAIGWRLLDEDFQPVSPLAATDTYQTLFPDG